MPGNSLEWVLSSSTFRTNWTFESMMPLAQATGFSDEAAAVHAGKVREIDLVRSSFAREYLAALVRARGPCAGEFERVQLLQRQQDGACHDCRGKDQVSKYDHRLFLEPLSVTAQHEENTSWTGGARWMLDLNQRSCARPGSRICAERRRTASRRHRSSRGSALNWKE